MNRSEEIITQLLSARGITAPEDVREYLAERPQRTYDPFLLKNMDQAVEQIRQAIAAGSKLCIYGDYDADGVTSVCILMTVLSQLTDRLMYYIPSRFSEGYGLNRQAVETIRRDGADLLITVDCGITSCDEIDYAKSLGLQVIVTDHHTPGGRLPACTVVDAKQPDETYPFRELAGCGVAFKLAQALQRRMGFDRSVIHDLLDIVAAGTVGDIVSLTDENRTIVKYGLQRLNEKRRPSLAALEEAISIQEINAENIAFGIIPHINAAGRMAHANEAVQLLLADDPQTIQTQTNKLLAYNSARKSRQEEAYQQSAAMLTGKEHFICLRLTDIHEGIAGIAAGKLKEACGRPVILTTPTGEGLLKGTGRSIPGVDIFAMLDQYRDLFLKFGGHRSACGFTIREELFPQLQQSLEEDAARLFAAHPQLLDLTGNYDLALAPEEVTLALAEQLARMEPFGEGNPRPRFLLRDVQLARPFFMGTDKTHVRFTAMGPGGGCQCVLFRRAQDYREALLDESRADLIGTIHINVWKETRRVQFIVEELLH